MERLFAVCRFSENMLLDITTFNPGVLWSFVEFFNVFFELCVCVCVLEVCLKWFQHVYN